MSAHHRRRHRLDSAEFVRLRLEELEPREVPAVISGTVFEDVNYSGGAGRSLADSGGVGLRSATVELYDAVGAFVQSTNTDFLGNYQFNGVQGNGTFFIRVVNSTVTSSRPGMTAGLLPVQTFQTIFADSAAIPITDRVGGAQPAAEDSGLKGRFGNLNDSAVEQSVTTVLLGNVQPFASVTSVNFGFNFDTIVNTNNAGQGSLAQFIVNSNALGNSGLAQVGQTAGVEASIFMIPSTTDPLGRPADPNFTASRAIISLTSVLPPITDANTHIDGTTQTANVGDTNAGTLGAGGTVGVDNLTLPTVPRPEVELRDGTSVSIGLTIHAPDALVRGLAAFGFGSANVFLAANGDGVVIEQNVLGSGAIAFADPGSAARSGGDNIRGIDASDVVVRNNLIGFAAGHGVWPQFGPGWRIEGNEVRSNALVFEDYDGIEVNGSITNVVQGNLVVDSGGAGVDLLTATDTNVANNTIVGNGRGDEETAGIAIRRIDSTNNTVSGNVVAANVGPGVLVTDSSAGNVISQNSTFANGGLGIDLAPSGTTGDGVTLNDPGDADSGSNGLLNFPVLVSAAVSGDTLELTGFARPGSAIELFIADPDPRGYGEGQTYLATLTEGSAADLDGTTGSYGPAPINGLLQGSDTTNRFRFFIPLLSLADPVTAGMVLTATATSANATSEFSGNVAVAATPAAVDDAYSTPEDTLLTVPLPGVLGNDTDPDGDPLQATVQAGPAHGMVTLNSDGSFTYTPDADFNGEDQFTYTVSDSRGGTDTATVSITVDPVNDPPVAHPNFFSTPEDTPLAGNVLGNDTDADGDILQATVATGPSSGMLTLNPDGTFTYTPNMDFNGVDTFTYTISDGNGGKDTAMVTIGVGGTNDPPVAIDDIYSTNEDTPLTITAPGVLGNDSDVDGDPLQAFVDTGPANGTVTLNPDGSFTYTPDAEFNGQDQFTYNVSDGKGGAAIAVVRIAVVSANDAPVAFDDSYSTREDTSLTIAAPGVLGNDSDADGDPLEAVVLTDPAKGAVTLNADGSFSYTPDPDFSGQDQFTYEVSDGQGGTASATVTITVDPVNDPPVARPNFFTTPEDTLLSGNVLGNDIDPDGDPLTVTANTQPTNGTLSLNPDGSFTYTPNTDFNGLDSFSYTISDGNGLTDTARVVIGVGGENDAPVAVDDNYSTTEDTPLVVPATGVLANDTDADGDRLQAIVETDPTNGTVRLAPDGSFIYSPNANFNGQDQFTYTVSDGQGGTATATVTITIDAANDPPKARPNFFITQEDTPLSGNVLGNDTDPEGDTLKVTTNTDPAHGTVTINADGSFIYTPIADFRGVDNFRYTISDGNGGSDTTYVLIGVRSVNDPPVAVDDQYTTDEDTQLTIAAPGVLANDTDPEGDPLQAFVETDPANGTVTINPDGSFTYTPNVDFNGDDKFTYTVSDGKGGTDTATVTITIKPVPDGPGPGPTNRPPIAVDDTFTTQRDTALSGSVLPNDSDPDGDPLTVRLVSGPTSGNLTLNPDGTFNFTPGTVFVGTSSFVYEVSDGRGGTDTATVAITVRPPSAPVKLFAVGAGPGGGPHVLVFNRDGTLRFSFYAFDQAFRGGVTVATADVNRDGVEDVIVGAGPGGSPHVRIFSGVDQSELASFFAFDPRFSGGVFVAAGNVDADPDVEIVTGAGAGGMPQVRVFDFNRGSPSQVAGPLGSFLAYAPNFMGGVNVAAGDTDGDGIDEVVTGSGMGGGGLVKVFKNSGEEIAAFQAYAPGFPSAVFVGAGDLDGDGRAEIVTGAGSGGGPHVKVFRASDLAEVRSFYAYAPFMDPSQVFSGGVHVTVDDVIGDGRGDLITGAGPTGGPHVRAWNNDTQGFTDLVSRYAYEVGFLGGVFVG